MQLTIGFNRITEQLTYVKRTKIEIETLDRKRREKMVQVYLRPTKKKRMIVKRQNKIKLRF
jgi:succinyl-CoA synthetase beta subunit